MMLLEKTTLNIVDLLISNVLIEWNISHDEFVLKIDVLKEYDDVKGKIKHSNNIKRSLLHAQCSMFTKNNNIKIKREIDGKINLCYCCLTTGLKCF